MRCFSATVHRVRSPSLPPKRKRARGKFFSMQRFIHPIFFSLSSVRALVLSLFRTHVWMWQSRLPSTTCSSLVTSPAELPSLATVYHSLYNATVAYPDMQRWHKVNDTPSQNCIGSRSNVSRFDSAQKNPDGRCHCSKPTLAYAERAMKVSAARAKSAGERGC